MSGAGDTDSTLAHHRRRGISPFSGSIGRKRGEPSVLGIVLDSGHGPDNVDVVLSSRPHDLSLPLWGQSIPAAQTLGVYQVYQPKQFSSG